MADCIFPTITGNRTSGLEVCSGTEHRLTRRIRDGADCRDGSCRRRQPAREHLRLRAGDQGGRAVEAAAGRAVGDGGEGVAGENGLGDAGGSQLGFQLPPNRPHSLFLAMATACVRAVLDCFRGYQGRSRCAKENGKHGQSRPLVN